MMIGHVEMHDRIVPLPGFFWMVVIFGAGCVQVKERTGEKPQQNRQACWRRQKSPHAGIVDDRPAPVKDFRSR